MKKLFLLMFLLAAICYSQKDSTDRLELKNDKIITGKVVKIKPATVEFKEFSTDLLYEYEKKEIRYIILSSGKIMIFEDYAAKKPEPKPIESEKQPIIVKDDSGPGIGVVILAVLGGLVVIGALVGAAQSK
jgi:hypothetical protein